MKTLLSIAFLLTIIFTSCSKEKIQPLETEQYVTNVSWYAVKIDGVFNAGFVFTIVSDNISKITLVRIPGGGVETINNPAKSVHTIYDPLGLPSKAQNIFYQFEIVTKSGSKIILDKFHVYY